MGMIVVVVVMVMDDLVVLIWVRLSQGCGIGRRRNATSGIKVVVKRGIIRRRRVAARGQWGNRITDISSSNNIRSRSSAAGVRSGCGVQGVVNKKVGVIMGGWKRVQITGRNGNDGRCKVWKMMMMVVGRESSLKSHRGFGTGTSLFGRAHSQDGG